ncbi:Protein Niban 1 [Manis javanica]|nr:Protein Niban 1 [Manis javanica]
MTDYFCDQQIDEVLSKLRNHFGSHMHSRKEVENYLLMPAVLDRVIGRGIAEWRAKGFCAGPFTEFGSGLLEADGRTERRCGATRRRRLVRRTYEPGMSVSLVARQEDVSAGLLFQWRSRTPRCFDRRLAGEAVVPASELAAARAEIAKLQRVLGKKTLENEILKEAVEYAAEKLPTCPAMATDVLCALQEPGQRTARAPKVNAKRVYRVMAQAALLLPKAPRRRPSVARKATARRAS